MLGNTCYLRQWQKDSLVGYLERLNKQFSELTIAYQGSGKTIYAALCFTVSVLKDPYIRYLSLDGIGENFKRFNTKSNDFAVIFVPKNSIKDSTIEAWNKLGIGVICLKNEKLLETSPGDLIRRGYNGLICTYRQATEGASPFAEKEWDKNILIQFLKRSPSVKIHGILDECHVLTATKNKNDRTLTKTAKFFVHNKHIFCKLHLLTATIQKVGYQFTVNPNLYPKDERTVPYVRYSLNGDAIADTVYTKGDAIRDGVIVKTTPVLHSVNHANLFINGVLCSLTQEDIKWYCEAHKEGGRSEKYYQVRDAFEAIYGSTEIWTEFLVYGDYWLQSTRNVYPKAKGIIFTPSVESAIQVHVKLLANRSVLCLGEKPEDTDSDIKNNFIPSDKIHQWLKKNGDTIDWIVSCEALNLGFDYPDCKVSILIPRLEFLGLPKLTQSMQRVNRSIQGYPDLTATCITLDYEPIVELIKLEQDEKFGLCESFVYTSEILDLHTYRVIETSIRKTEALILDKPFQVNDVKIVNFALDAFTKKMTADGEVLYCYNPEVKKDLTEVAIRTYWTLWVNMSTRLSQSSKLGWTDVDKIPPKKPGVYIIVNAKTTEYLYVGSSDNLHKRLCFDNRKKDYRKFKELEGVKTLFLDLYVAWIVTDNYLDQEDLCKDQLKPKYDKEKRRLKSYSKDILVS